MSERRFAWLPILEWGRNYDRDALGGDLLAAVIVTIMLIPQSLAYALLAGLPAEMGLYASILPLIAYALLGSSRTLSVGPVAVVSLMTAAAIGRFAEQGTAEYLAAAMALALLSGLILVLMGLLRFGFLANFLSHPVVAGFITASGVIIALSQLRHILGVEAHGENLIELGGSHHALGKSGKQCLVTTHVHRQSKQAKEHNRRDANARVRKNLLRRVMKNDIGPAVRLEFVGAIKLVVRAGDEAVQVGDRPGRKLVGIGKR